MRFPFRRRLRKSLTASEKARRTRRRNKIKRGAYSAGLTAASSAVSVYRLHRLTGGQSATSFVRQRSARIRHRRTLHQLRAQYRAGRRG